MFLFYFVEIFADMPLTKMSYLCRRSYSEVLKDLFEETFLGNQKLLSSEERYEKILNMIPDECMNFSMINTFLKLS